MNVYNIANYIIINQIENEENLPGKQEVTSNTKVLYFFLKLISIFVDREHRLEIIQFIQSSLPGLNVLCCPDFLYVTLS